MSFPSRRLADEIAPKLPGTDGRKMSKSYGNAILLTDPEPVVRQKLKTMVTDPARVRRSDPGNPDVCPVGDLHKIFSDRATMDKVNVGCRSAGIGCIECKSWAADALVQLLSPMQERRKKFEENPRLAWDILEAGSERARKVAAADHGRRARRDGNVAGLRAAGGEGWKVGWKTELLRPEMVARDSVLQSLLANRSWRRNDQEIRAAILQERKKKVILPLRFR
jgi:hypothetical protein